VRAVADEIAKLPPLVFAGECDQLRTQLAAVARGEAFVLQGGELRTKLVALAREHERRKLGDLVGHRAHLGGIRPFGLLGRRARTPGVKEVHESLAYRPVRRARAAARPACPLFCLAFPSLRNRSVHLQRLR